MKHTQSLPEPSADALQHSQKLVARIRDEIESNDGSIPFRRYMEMALYEFGLGYYVAGTHKIGAEGDFITAPEISPLFSQCLAKQCADALKGISIDTPKDTLSNDINKGSQNYQKTGGWVLELGAGSGIMATEILLELERQNQLPEQYLILDLSPDLKQRQKQTLSKHIPHLLDRIQWIDQLPENFEGIIIGNEVLDAMPVEVFTQHNEAIYQHHVVWENDQLREQLKPAKDNLKQAIQALNISHEATPYTSEINPNLLGWFQTLSNCLKSGIILLIDYGYPRKEYYLSERKKGTLICHYQHLVNEAPLFYPGLQDITASVDFTAVAEAADAAGLSTSGFTSQAAFLTNAGLEEYFLRALETNPKDQYRLAQQVRTLSLPSEMGERFKVIALSKNIQQSLLGFSTLDQRYRL